MSFDSLYKILEVDSKTLKTLKSLAGVKTDEISGALSVILYNTLQLTYGLTELQSLEVVKNSKVAMELVDELLAEDDQELKPIPVVIADRRFVSIYTRNEEAVTASILDLETMDVISAEEYYHKCPSPITSDAIDLTAVLVRVIIPHLESETEASGTESQESSLEK